MAAAAVLVLVVSSPTMFISAVGAAAVRSDIVDGCRYGVGLTVETATPLPGAGDPADSFEARQRYLDRLQEATPGMTPVVVTMGSGPATVSTGKERPGEGGLQILSRTGAEREVRWVAGGPGQGQGLWLPDRSAELLRAGPGDEVDVILDGVRMRRTVDGVFEDLTYADRSSFWCSNERAFEAFGTHVPPPVALMDQHGLSQLLQEAGRAATRVHWEVPPQDDHLTLPDAARAADELGRRLTALRSGSVADVDANPFAHDRIESSLGLPASVDHAGDVGDAVRPLVETLGVASFGIALLVVAAAGRSWSEARAGEVRMLASKGVSPLALSAKATLEMAPATIVGGGLGFRASRALVVSLGPAAPVGADAVRRAAVSAVIAVGVALVLLAAMSVRRVVRAEARLRPRVGWWSRVPWELAALGAAAWAFVQLRSPASRVSSVSGASYPADTLLVLFPLLLLAGAALLLLRGLRLVQRLLRHRGGRAPLPLFLAFRRLGAGGPSGLALVAGATVSIGILVYAAVVGASARATVVAKATVGPGTDLVVFPGALTEQVPPELADRASTVVRSAATLTGGRGRVSVLGVDPATFARAAFFDPTFAGDSLDELLGRLAPAEGRVRAIAVGEAPRTVSLEDGVDESVDVDVVARVEAFPGLSVGLPMLVLDAASLEAAGLGGTPEMWVRGDPDASLARLRSSDYDWIHTVRAVDSLSASSLLPMSTSLDYFSALGLLGGAVTASAVVLYLMARAKERRLAMVMARRMGVRAPVEVAAATVELSALLLTGLVVATALALPAAAAVFPHLDPSPGTPPSPLVRLELHVVVVVAVVCVTIAAVAALGSVVGSRRRSDAEVMRHVP